MLSEDSMFINLVIILMGVHLLDLTVCTTFILLSFYLLSTTTPAIWLECSDYEFRADLL